MASLKIIFAGTPEFAASALAAILARTDTEILAVYTQPDRPAGRGQQVRQSAVKTLAVAEGLPIRQPSSLRDPQAVEALAALAADLLVVAAYGQILPQSVLDAPRLGAINVHASLLPRWRGAAPIQRAIMAGDSETGITIMRMVTRLDAGPMLLQRACPIGANETGGSLHDRLASLGGIALGESLDLFHSGAPGEIAQDEKQVTYARKIERTDREIDWERSAIALERQVRALAPTPLAISSLGGMTANLVAVEALAETANGSPGTLDLGQNHLDVATGDGVLRVHSLQPSGKNIMQAREFINGYRQRLGS